MTIHLPKELEQSIHAAVKSGRFASVDEAMAEAARLLVREWEISRPEGMSSEVPARPVPLPDDPDDSGTSIGLFKDIPELMDRIVAEAMHDRRHLPLRAEDRE